MGNDYVPFHAPSIVGEQKAKHVYNTCGADNSMVLW